MATYRQDRAPPGGYKDIDWTRVTRKRVSGFKILGGILVMKAVGLTWWYLERRKMRLELCEEFDGRVALTPFITAETDRLSLKQCIVMRDEEKELMKDKPDWEVGTWNGTQLFHDEQNRFDSMMPKEKNAFLDKWRRREAWRVSLGLNPEILP